MAVWNSLSIVTQLISPCAVWYPGSDTVLILPGHDKAQTLPFAPANENFTSEQDQEQINTIHLFKKHLHLLLNI